MRFNNISGGGYTVIMEWSQGWTGNGQGVNVSSGSVIRTNSATGTLPQGTSMRIRVSGPSGTLTTDWLSRDQWAGVPLG